MKAFSKSSKDCGVNDFGRVHVDAEICKCQLAVRDALLRQARNEIQKIPVENRDCVLYDSINRAIGELAE